MLYMVGTCRIRFADENGDDSDAVIKLGWVFEDQAYGQAEYTLDVGRRRISMSSFVHR